MPEIKHIRILRKFEPFFRLLKAYNANSFAHSSCGSLLPSVGYAFCATLMNASLTIVIVLIVWNLIENNADTNTFVVTLPIVASLLMTELMFVAMMAKNGTVTETIDRLQMVIDRR